MSLEYLTIGFGSHHWRAVDTDDRPWFVTVDDVVAKRRARDEDATTVFERLRAALTTANDLRDSGADFVVAPLPGRTGTVVQRISARFALALYPFLDGVTANGEYGSAVDRRAVLEMVTTIHATPRTVTPDAHGRRLRARRTSTSLVCALDELAGPWEQRALCRPRCAPRPARARSRARARALRATRGRGARPSRSHGPHPRRAPRRERARHPDRDAVDRLGHHTDRSARTRPLDARSRRRDGHRRVHRVPRVRRCCHRCSSSTACGGTSRRSRPTSCSSTSHTGTMQIPRRCWKNLQLFLDPTRWSTPG